MCPILQNTSSITRRQVWMHYYVWLFCDPWKTRNLKSSSNKVKSVSFGDAININFTKLHSRLSHCRNCIDFTYHCNIKQRLRLLQKESKKRLEVCQKPTVEVNLGSFQNKTDITQARRIDLVSPRRKTRWLFLQTMIWFNLILKTD